VSLGPTRLWNMKAQCNYSVISKRDRWYPLYPLYPRENCHPYVLYFYVLYSFETEIMFKFFLNRKSTVEKNSVLCQSVVC